MRTRTITRRAVLALAAAAGAAACSSVGSTASERVTSRRTPTPSPSTPTPSSSTPTPRPSRSLLPVRAPELTSDGQDARTSPGSVPQMWIIDHTTNGRLQDWVIGTDAVDAPVRIKVLVPTGYDANPTRRYPVLFLLHGSTGDSGSWLSGGSLLDIVGDQDVILVMPDGGPEGWYVDWAVQDPPARWETLHVIGILPIVDLFYRTLGRRTARGVAGISMGGFGALHYAEAYPDLFAAASSFSGPLSLRTPRDLTALDADALPGKPANAIFGSDAQRTARIDRVDPPLHAANLATTRVRLYCGDGVTKDGTDNGEVGFLGSNRIFLEAARSAGVDASLTVLPGGHDWTTWTPAIAKDFPGLIAALDAAQ